MIKRIRLLFAESCTSCGERIPAGVDHFGGFVSPCGYEVVICDACMWGIEFRPHTPPPHESVEGYSSAVPPLPNFFPERE